MSFSLIMLSQERLTKHRVTSVFATATPPKCLKGIRCRRDEKNGARSLNRTVQWKSTLSDVIHMKRGPCRDTCVTQIVSDSETLGTQIWGGVGRGVTGNDHTESQITGGKCRVPFKQPAVLVLQTRHKVTTSRATVSSLSNVRLELYDKNEQRE